MRLQLCKHNKQNKANPIDCVYNLSVAGGKTEAFVRVMGSTWPGWTLRAQMDYRPRHWSAGQPEHFYINPVTPVLLVSGYPLKVAQ